MSASTTSSLHFLSLTHKTLSSKPSSTTCNSLSLFPPSSLINKPLPKLFTTSLSSSIKLFQISPPSRLKVALSSDFGVAEDTSTLESEEDERSFSPDLKLFVGNLPFSCDSAVLAKLFERAGNVQMVELQPFQLHNHRPMDDVVIFGSMDDDLENTVRRFRHNNVGVVIRNEYELNYLRIREMEKKRSDTLLNANFKGKEKATSSSQGTKNKDCQLDWSEFVNENNRVYTMDLCGWNRRGCAFSSLGKVRSY